MSTFCYTAPKQSVRFVHKFDPVPSMMMWTAKYQHKVENAIMLWDLFEPGCASESVGCDISSRELSTGETDYKLLGLKGTNPDLLKSWVCTKSSSMPITMATVCEQELTSYFTLMNPFPCGWILAKTYLDGFTAKSMGEGTVDHADTAGDIVSCLQEDDKDGKGCMVGFKWLTGSGKDSTIMYNNVQYDAFNFISKFFALMEDFDTCVSDWTSTMFTHYSADVVNDPKLMGLMFTFTWLHSTYGMYPLCVEVDSSGKVESYIPTSVETAIIAEVEEYAEEPVCDSTAKTACYDFCGLSGYKFTDSCYDDCLENDCKPVPVKSINEEYSISTTVMATYAGSDWEEEMVEEEWMAAEMFYAYGEDKGKGSGSGSGKGSGRGAR
jgi:hypothetical protein